MQTQRNDIVLVIFKFCIYRIELSSASMLLHVDTGVYLNVVCFFTYRILEFPF